MRNFLSLLDHKQQLIKTNRKISKEYQIAAILKQLEPDPVFFSDIHESSFPVVGNLFCSKRSLAQYFNIAVEDIIPFLVNAINNPTPPEKTNQAACQEIVIDNPDLDKLPILKHCLGDGGHYISSGVFIASHPIYGQNLDFHRCMQISKNEFAVRVVKNRHFDHYLQDLRHMDVAVCIGLPPGVLLAAATSVGEGQDELDIANSLEAMQIVKAKSVDLWVPAECEFVLEGRISLDKTHIEGPFVDLTGTYDIVREQPILEVKTITHRENAIWHALLPGGLEHKLLMGLPREPTIFQKVNEVVKCLDINITPGGASWLHAVIQIDKQEDRDGKAAIQAAFSGHRSCKHVFVVDKDIDIYDPHQVEWALATRFQGDQDMIIMPREQGSSLDPSADPKTSFTTKIGFDLTKPMRTTDKSFDKAEYPLIDIDEWISE